mgnify:FL=1
MSKKIISILSAVLILVVAILGSKLLMSQKEPMKRMGSHGDKERIVNSRVIQNDNVSVQIPITGRVRSVDYYDIYAEVSGTLMNEAQSFKEGTRFSKGDIILRIDDREARYSLMAEKSSLLNVITQLLPDLKIDFPNSYPNWEAFLKSFDLNKPLGILPEPISEKEKYFIALRNIYSLYYTVQSLEVRLEKYSIRAPYDGMVTQADITSGTLVRIGQKLGSYINNDAFELEVTLSMDELDIISIGNMANLKSSDIPGSWTAKIIRINEQIDASTQTVKVFLRIHQSSLIDGMYLNGVIQSNIINNVCEVPRKLITDAETVFIIESSELLAVPVDVVKEMESTSLISGLRNGTELLDEIIVGAKNGMSVSTVKEGQ